MKGIVVKLGGSTAGHDEMKVWIAALAGSSLPLVIVPGGGPFADQVRSAQKGMGFSDAAAHAMAILAMDQFGHVIVDSHKRFSAAHSIEEIERASAVGKIPVWLPSALATPAQDIPASWEITSDSLAAWLAGKLGAEALLLVKQSRAFTGDDGVADLMARGIVDTYLAAMLPAATGLYVAGAQDTGTAAATLSSGRIPGIRIVDGNPMSKAG
ncbi:dihydroneopterin aldolase [Mesorhizobium sp. YM1C-6-2]|uniref:amino acid kinase family protein n=1 Tax=Mesorhizobium sp. YM1C-6-2 TaxID=1827501 RepID=UPI000EF19E7D|nr:dihydroneopterin aldolase [Mesorhizobium sp. YM1C-6-2]RLP22698.1 dihydroneopterin aldolase [Mesorhizobium sp. YM1C-6-2]